MEDVQRTDVYELIHDEQVRAHNKHLAKGWSMEKASPNDPRWLPVLVEEVGEVANALNEGALAGHLAEELLQVAAMACAWIDALALKP